MDNESCIETSDTSPIPEAKRVFDVIPIDRLVRPTAADFDRYAAAAKPFIIEGIAACWKVLGAWTPDYLRTRAGAALVPVLKVPDGDPDGKFFYGDNVADMVNFVDCLPLLEGAPPRFYMAGVPIAEYLPMLAEDLEPLDFLDEKRQQKRQLWISGKNSKGPLHFDLDDNIHVVLAGRKRFLMFDYAQTPNLYPTPAFSETPHYSLVDAQEPDIERFPRVRLAQCYDVTLRPTW